MSWFDRLVRMRTEAANKNKPAWMMAQTIQTEWWAKVGGFGEGDLWLARAKRTFGREIGNRRTAHEIIDLALGRREARSIAQSITAPTNQSSTSKRRL